MSINTLDNLINGIITHGPNVLKYAITDVDVSRYVDRLTTEHLDYPIPPKQIDKSNWLIPQEYKSMDIESYLVDICPKENYDRLIEELELYRSHKLVPVLRIMKYIVDTLRKNNIVWGVGRGSSVASYVLFLLGVHKIDSVKYDLPIEEFFKGEKNG
jgi:DNA polymerase III alpha subunit